MRTHRLLVAGPALLMASLAVAAGIGIDARPVYAAGAQLTVNPTKGAPDAPFTAVYRFPRQNNQPCGPAVVFHWDGAELDRATPVPAGDACVATLHRAPPPGAYPKASTHVISAGARNGTGGNQVALAAYTVTPVPAATPTAAGTAAPGARPPSAAAVPAPSGTATPGRSPSATAEAAVPQDSDEAGALPEADAVGPPAVATGDRAAGDGGSSATGWLVAAGTVLFLAGAATFGAIAWRARRAKAAEAADGAVLDDGTDSRGTIEPLTGIVLSPPPDAATHRFPAAVYTSPQPGQPTAEEPRPKPQEPPVTAAQPETAPTREQEPPVSLPEQRAPQPPPLTRRRPGTADPLPGQ
ncbi:hypothetical protein ACNTMW_15640 [Planosporangium sp. 12N6]|uniref:hypothetical protein n=1 Tax=Planosporangium spinosum TaxID=3402278 RepID=UPI003CEFCF7F